MKFSECDAALKAGKKVKLKAWENAYWQVKDGELINHDEEGVECNTVYILPWSLICAAFGDWEIVEEDEKSENTSEDTVETFDFGKAIQLLKEGHHVARKGWNGKEQYLELGYNIDYEDDYGRCYHAYHEDIGSMAIVFVGTRGKQIGWLASQSDMLAEDWVQVDKEEN